MTLLEQTRQKLETSIEAWIAKGNKLTIGIFRLWVEDTSVVESLDDLKGVECACALGTLAPVNLPTLSMLGSKSNRIIHQYAELLGITTYLNHWIGKDVTITTPDGDLQVSDGEVYVVIPAPKTNSK